MGAGQSHDLSKIQYAIGINNEDKKDNESQIYRNPKSVGRDLFNHKTEFQTIHDIYRSILKDHKDSEFLGRRLKNEKGELENSFTFQTYGEIFEIAENFGSKISDMVTKVDKDSGMKFVATFSKNNYDLLISDIACCMQGLTMVPLYDTLGDEANHFIFNQTEVEICLIESKKLEKLLKLKKEKNWYKHLKTLIILDFENHDPEIYKEAKEYYECHTFDGIVQMGSLKKKQWAKITPETVYTFSYTGGTTGMPKGAIVTNKNFISIIQPVKDQLNFHKEVHISYLPLPHILERAMFMISIATASKIGVYSGDIKILVKDIQILKPTFFVSAPRFYNKVHTKILAGVEEKNFIVKKLFNRALNVKIDNLRGYGIFTHSLYDKIFKGVRNLLGGNIKCFIAGGAPMNKDVMDFFKVAYGVPFFEAYGQTEGLGAEFCTLGHEAKSGSVGGPFEQHEFKLVDVPQMKYLHTDKDKNGNPSPRGELWIRGPNVIQGYYKLPEKTKELFSSDGWMKSGDIVQLSYPQNKLYIIDRKKHIFKLSHGEYVAPEKLENIYKSFNEFIANIYIYGDSNHSYLVALINVEINCVEKFAHEFGIVKNGDEDLLVNKDLKKIVLEKLIEFGKGKGLNNIEIVRDLVFDNIEWIQNGLITPAMKNKRLELRNYYKDRMTALYPK